MSKISEENEADRLTSEEFVDLIPHLPFENILQIEFFSTGWKKLISTVDHLKRLYRCNLCHPILSGPKSVLSHINGKKHLGNMALAKYFYHPEYTFTKVQLQKACVSDNIKNNKSNMPEVKSGTKPHQDTSSDAADLEKDPKVEKSTQISTTTVENITTPKKTYLVKDNEFASTEATHNGIKNTSKENKVSIVNEYNDSTQKGKFSPEGNKIINSSNEISKHTPGKLAINEKIYDSIPQKINKPLLRLVPMSELRQIPNDDVKNNDPKTSGNCSTSENLCLKKTVTTDIKMKTQGLAKSKIGNTKPSNNKEKPTEGKLDQQFNKFSPNTERTRNIETNIQKKKNEIVTLNNQQTLHNNGPNHLNDSKTKNNLPVKVNIQSNKDKKDFVESSSNPLEEGVSRKLVKNPLAARENDLSNAAKKLTRNTINTADMDVIIIDDYDEQIQSNLNDLKQNNMQVLDLPSKRLKSEQSVIQTSSTQTSKVNISSSRPNLVVIPTKTNMSSVENKDKSTNEPLFAAKSVTDAMSKEDLAGLVGVEYVIKICRNGTPIKYECGLCELILGGQCMQNHLLGYSHRLKFCEKHFPTAIQQFRQFIVNVPSDEHYKVMIPVLQKLSVAIEEHHGRSLPYECNEHRYNIERHRVLTDVFARRHASEQKGPTFTHVIDSKQVDEFILQKDSVKLQSYSQEIVFDKIATEQSSKPNQEMRQNMYQPSPSIHHNVMTHPLRNTQPNRLVPPTVHPFSGQNTFVDDETHKRMVENFLKANSQSGFSQHKSYRPNRNEREHRSTQMLKRSHSPSQTYYDSKRDQHSSLNIWNSYCRLVESRLMVLKEKFQKYKANPESHPSYKDEWLKYWHRRKTELIAIGRDYRTYDFQPGWVPYFNNRINELYNESFEKLKIEAREELSLPMTNEFLGDPKFFVHVKQKKYISQINTDLPAKTNFIHSQMNISNNSCSNLYQEPNIASLASCGEDANIVHSKMKSNSKEVEAPADSSPTVISVLRLLTALEEFLGSLGPKVVDLLSKALQVEKSNHGNAQILLTEENCSVLETAMEKFKGLVFAGILDVPKGRAVKKAIFKINDLLEHTKAIKTQHSPFKKICNPLESDTYPNENPSTNSKPTQNINDKLKSALQSVSNASDISKVIHLIEEKISATLKAQGHTDVDRAHLEQLAAVCVLLEKKKREAGKSENQDSTAPKQKLTLPLSDTLKKIVGNLPTSLHQQQYTQQNKKADQRSAQIKAKGQINTRTSESSMESLMMQKYNNLPKAIEFNNLNNGNLQGNFSNLYGKSNNGQMTDDKINFGGNSLLRQWPQEQQQQSVSLLGGWPNNSSRPWNTALPMRAASYVFQRDGYHSFVQEPPIEEGFRHN